MVSVCMYVCMDGCMLDKCLTEKSITYSHTQRNFFLTADLAWPKLTPPPPQTESGKICHLPNHFDHFLELNNYWPNLKVIHAFSRELWPFKIFFFSTFLYILQFSNGNNSLNKQDRNIVSNSKILSYLDSGSRKNMFFKFWVESLK